MNKERLIQECIEELGIAGTDNEQAIRSMLQQVADKKPDDNYDEIYLEKLLVQLQQQQRRKQSGVTGWIQRYKKFTLAVPALLVIFVVGLWSYIQQPDNTEEQPILYMQPRVVNMPIAEHILTEQEAIDLLQATYEELEIYPADTLPPRSILTKQYHFGRLVAFITEGSGVPGILEARCYQVTHTEEITETGTFIASNGALKDKETFDVGMCE